MERLTEWTGEAWITKQERINGKYITDRDVYEKLADYEELGMTPDEIHKVIREGVPEWIPRYLEYRELDNQGLLIKLPCKVGDVVYEVNTGRNIISSYKITSIVMMEGSRNYNWQLVDGLYTNLNGFNESAIGKIVFLTREEAEKELGEHLEVKGGSLDE